MNEVVTCSEKAYQTLLTAILNGEFPKGEFLNQRMLAAFTGTSIISVREALKQLAHEHIVESIPKWGVRIPLDTRQRITDLYRVREGLEVMAAYLLNILDDPTSREELYRKAEECDCISTDSVDGVELFAKTHREFHILLAEKTGNSYLQKELERFALRSFLYQSAKSTWAQEVHDWQHWHRNLVSEIFSQDAVRAQEAMHAHIEHGLHNDLILFEQGLFK
jgi:DNA-binding GntR family transcriptional regulator